MVPTSSCFLTTGRNTILSPFPDTGRFHQYLFHGKKKIQTKLVFTAVASWYSGSLSMSYFVLYGALRGVRSAKPVERTDSPYTCRNFVRFCQCMLDLRQFTSHTSPNVFPHSNHLSLVSRPSDHCELAAPKWAQGKPTRELFSPVQS